jgi:DNA-binding GntR family transcriptional regulator
MKEHAPKTYEAYLIAIAQGDADEARRIMSEVFEEEE